MDRTSRILRASYGLYIKSVQISLRPKRYNGIYSSYATLSTNQNKTVNQKNIYLIDESNETNQCENHVGTQNKYTMRSFTCGELRIDHVGLNVTLCGWLEYQRMKKFIVLRDGYGEVQLMLRDDDMASQKLIELLPYESIIEITGRVLSRPIDMINKDQSTGEIEVVVNTLKVLNKAKPNLPFNIREFQKAKESLRMQFRYLDLRFPQMQRNMRVRSQLLMKMREFLINKCGFVDVETPTLFKATPGGAQEFIVPTRFAGQFYSLVQSPQQFKQMLMAGAMDRYFQVARCYRDETSRPDRQPEFTQLDIEMSFTNINGIIELVEDLLQYIWPQFIKPLPKKIDRITYNTAMDNYGTDKPDTRYDFLIQDCTHIFQKSVHVDCYSNFKASFLIFKKGILTKSIREHLSHTLLDNTKLLINKISTKEQFIIKAEKLLSKEIATKLYENYDLDENDVIFLVLGEKNNSLKRLGKIRVDYVNHLEDNGFKIKQDGHHFIWITDWPLFENGDKPHSYNSAHHPFTSPNQEDVHLLKTNPLQIRGLSYDLVLNGNEVAGGSIRIHDAKLQEIILDMLGINKDALRHMIEMLESGCPPHGGIAIGIDRLMTEILNTNSIRDVIAFPKTFEGKDSLSGAPSPISDKDKLLYHL